jgi:ATP-dependent RNA helicase DHX57
MAMTLPPSIRPYWTTLTAEKASAPDHRAWEWNSDPFAAKKEVDSRQEKRKEKEKAREEGDDGHGGGGGSGVRSVNGGGGGGGRGWEGVPEVRMAPSLREHVEGTVRKVSPSERCGLGAG